MLLEWKDVRVTQSLDDIGTIRLEYNSPNTIGESGVELVYKSAEEIEPLLAKQMDPKNPTGEWLPNKGQKTNEEVTAMEDDFYPQANKSMVILIS